MSQAVQNIKIGTLISAVDSIRNWRAVLLMFGAMFLAGLLWGLGGWLSMKIHPAAGLLFFLAGLATFFYGINGVGIMLMDEARGVQSRPIVSAVLESLATGHRLILAFLMFGLIYVAGLLVVAMMLLMCKIPLLGPLMFTFVFPVSVVLVGVAIFALQMVVFPLTAPAIWAGATTMQAVSRVGAIARAKVVNVMLMMIVLTLIVLAVVFTVGGILFTGTMVTAGLAAGILNIGTDFGEMSQLFTGGFNGSGYFIAASFGAGIVYAVGFSLASLVFSRGCCSVYLISIEGVDVQAMESVVQSKIDEARHRAQEARAKAAPAPAPVFTADAQPFAPLTPTTAAPTAMVVPSAAATLNCPQCHAPHLPDDRFCGECGLRLAS
ncbi:MAG: hypothetical protein IPN53_05950 [Comamonadaceae bacterium]|nr:hypothetical protein [Comamonadaceae bacterium]